MAPSGPPSGSPNAADVVDTACLSGDELEARLLSTCASTWTAPDVAAWVAEVLRLPQYAKVFEVQQIDGPTLLELPEDMLVTKLNMTNPIHRKKMIAHVKLLKAYVDNLALSSTRSSNGSIDNSSTSGSVRYRSGSALSNSSAGSALAERAAVRRGRSMDKLAILQESRQMNSVGPTPPASSRASSERGSPRSLAQRSQYGTTLSRRRGKSPDGKAMSVAGKRVEAWGELSRSCSRKGSFGKGIETIGTRGTGGMQSPISAPNDVTDPVTSYYFKDSFVRNTKSAVISPGVRKMLEFKSKQTSCSPGPAYKPQVQWSQLRVGGSIGAAKRFAYDKPNCHHWLSEVRED